VRAGCSCNADTRARQSGSELARTVARRTLLLDCAPMATPSAAHARSDTLVRELRDRTAASQALCAQSWEVEPPDGFEGLACTRFEISSRGDRVPGHLLEADRDAGARRPLVLLQHGAGGDRFSPYLQVARRWVEEGAAVATIDFPLHGERRSPKLTG